MLLVRHPDAAVIRRQDAASFTLRLRRDHRADCWFHDMLSAFEIVPDDRTFVSRLSYSAMLVAIGAGLTWRFARALNEVDSFAGQLVDTRARGRGAAEGKLRPRRRARAGRRTRQRAHAADARPA